MSFLAVLVLQSPTGLMNFSLLSDLKSCGSLYCVNTNNSPFEQSTSGIALECHAFIITISNGVKHHNAYILGTSGGLSWSFSC